MANPRKFSEKIALHNQKQAEETAAFEQIMKEVTSATKDVSYQNIQKHQLHISQNLLGTYRGGSLPNVNHIGNNVIDLPPDMFSLEEMKQQGRESRSRQVGPHRIRTCDNKHYRLDCSPYGSTYLSPPSDPSWRRTNSDSALHQSAMNQVEAYHNSISANSRRVPDDGLVMVDGNQMKAYCWDPKKQGLSPPGVQSRPKSCEVPGINIYHTEQDPGVVHIPISNSTGSLPDLTNLQFPSPLATPLDAEDQNTIPYDTTSLRVPSLHTRYLHTCKGMAVESQLLDSYQQQTTQYSVYQQQATQHSTQQALGVSSTQTMPTSHMGGYRSGSPAETTCSAPQSPVSQTLSPSSSPGLGQSPKTHFTTDQNYYHLATQTQQQHITPNTVQQSFEQFNLAQNAVLVDGRDVIDSSGYYVTTSPSHMVQYTQQSGQPQQTTPQTPQTPSSIPDIILTDFSTSAEDAITRQDFVKDIGTAMAGVTGSFDSDFFPSDDALKAGLDPIDFDGLQMLTDPDMVADSATEDSFRLDRL